MNISDHPRFQAPLDPKDPTYERDSYLRWWDEEGQFLEEPPTEAELEIRDPLEDLEERPEAKMPIQVPPSLSICRDCQFKIDNRPGWKRLLRPDSAQVSDLLCAAFPRKKSYNPITGREGFLPEGPLLPAAAQESEPFTRCLFVNPTGTCRLFRPKLTYR